MLSEIYASMSKRNDGLLTQLFNDAMKPKSRLKKKIDQKNSQLDNEHRIRNDVSELLNRKTCCLDQFAINEVISIRKYYQGLKTPSKKLFIQTFISTHPNNESTIVFNKTCCFSCYMLMNGVTSYKIKQAKRAIIDDLPYDEKHGNRDKEYNTKKKEQALAWFDNFLEYDGQYAPNRSEIHLSSCFTWSDIFQNYKQDVELPYTNITQFTSLIRQKYPKVVLPKRTRLGKCQECIELKLKMKKKGSLEDKEKVKQELAQHSQLHTKERYLYAKRSLKAKRFPDEVETIIIDGAEGLHFPNIYPVPKGVNIASCLKVGCYGLIAHGKRERLLKLILPIFRCGANLSCSVLFEYLWERKKNNTLPRILYIQADNCYKEIKNRYTLGFLALLIFYGWCDEIIISTMIPGHTHADIDQMFSTYSQAMGKGSASSTIATPDEFITNMKDYYKEEKTRPIASYLERMYDWVDFFDDNNEGCLFGFKGISAYHGLRLFKINNKPALQVKQYSHKLPEDEYYGPDSSPSTFYEIFNEGNIPKGWPKLVESVDIEKHVLSDLSVYEKLINAKAQLWLKECKESNGKFVLKNTLPNDFWLKSEQIPTRAITDESSTLEKAVALHTTKKSKKLHKPPTDLPQQYSEGEFILVWNDDPLDYEVAQVVYVDNLQVSVTFYKKNKEGEIMGPPFKLMTIHSSNLRTQVMLRAVRLVKGNKLDARVLTEAQSLIKRRKKESKERQEQEKKRKRVEEQQEKKKKQKPTEENTGEKLKRGRPKKKVEN